MPRAQPAKLTRLSERERPVREKSDEEAPCGITDDAKNNKGQTLPPIQDSKLAEKGKEQPPSLGPREPSRGLHKRVMQTALSLTKGMQSSKSSRILGKKKGPLSKDDDPPFRCYARTSQGTPMDPASHKPPGISTKQSARLAQRRSHTHPTLETLAPKDLGKVGPSRFSSLETSLKPRPAPTVLDQSYTQEEEDAWRGQDNPGEGEGDGEGGDYLMEQEAQDTPPLRLPAGGGSGGDAGASDGASALAPTALLHPAYPAAPAHPAPAATPEVECSVPQKYESAVRASLVALAHIWHTPGGMETTQPASSSQAAVSISVDQLLKKFMGDATATTTAADTFRQLGSESGMPHSTDVDAKNKSPQLSPKEERKPRNETNTLETNGTVQSPHGITSHRAQIPTRTTNTPLGSSPSLSIEWMVPHSTTTTTIHPNNPGNGEQQMWSLHEHHHPMGVLGHSPSPPSQWNSSPQKSGLLGSGGSGGGTSLGFDRSPSLENLLHGLGD